MLSSVNRLTALHRRGLSQYFSSSNVCNSSFHRQPKLYRTTKDPAKTARVWFPWLAAGAGICYVIVNHNQKGADNDALEIPSESSQLSNWSNTHHVETLNLYQPESPEELEAMVRYGHQMSKKMRCVGSALSPNGISFEKEGMISMALMDKVLCIDTERQLVTVQAGARVDQVVEAIRPHGLTLQNYASIREQQIGGFLQVGAHGTGPRIPPVDEQVVSMKIVTPAFGAVEFSPEKDPKEFYLARVALGCLGAVSEVTLKCETSHKLLEQTVVLSHDEIKKQHIDLLRSNQHVRYMWIPYTKSVVVVTCNPVGENSDGLEDQVFSKTLSPLSVLLQAHKPQISIDELKHLSFAEIRDQLIALNALDSKHIREVNEAEAEFWKQRRDSREGPSDKILGFDCGGEQWVSEVCFPTGTLESPSLQDINYMIELLSLIEEHNIPAPAPIEQRWTSSSKSPMSPAYSEKSDDLFSWVGIIMYLPSSEDQNRKEITSTFLEYRDLCRRILWDKYKAKEHWAKIEEPMNQEELRKERTRIRELYPVNDFNDLRYKYDPKGIMENTLIRKIFG